jgi:hypothetical protein
MAAERQRPRFAEEARAGLLIARQRRRHGLDRDLPAEARVAGAVDLTHAARSESA